MKQCSKCKTEKEDTDFSKNTIKCKECYKEYREKNKDKLKDYHKKYNIENKDYYKEYNKEYNLKNKDKMKDYNKEYKLNNKDKSKEWYLNNKDYYKKYYEDNKDKIKKNQKEYNKEYRKNRRQTDPIFRLFSIIRVDFNQRLKSYKIDKTYNYLSDDISEYIKYLEQHPNWNNNFNWDNFGKIWEVDHIVPVYYFKNILEKQEDDNIKEQLLRICWSKENLQPLWRTTEISKEYGFDVVGNRNKNRNIDFDNEESKLILDKINKIFS